MTSNAAPSTSSESKADRTIEGASHISPFANARSEDHDFDPDDVVLVHRATGAAVSLPRSVSHEELALSWTLSAEDRRLVLKHRGRANLLRFAAQLCAARLYGRFLSSYQGIPADVLGYLCRQLEIEPITKLPAHGRPNTESDYQREITVYLGLQPFDDAAALLLTKWVTREVPNRIFAGGPRSGLIAEAERYLRRHHIIIPPPRVLERAVNSAYQQAEWDVFRRITEQIPQDTKAAIDGLLQSTAERRTSDFFKFARYPPEAKARHIARHQALYEELAALRLEQLRFAGISQELVRRLAQAVRTYSAWQIRRFPEEKRYALATAFLYDARKTLLDDLAEMHAQFMTAMQREARNAWEKEHRQMRSRAKRGVTRLRQFAEAALAAPRDGEATLKEFVERADPVALEEAVADCRAFERLEEHGYLTKLLSKYPNFRRYFRQFVELGFACELGGESILEGIEVLRRLNAGELRSLPEDIVTSFVPSTWRTALRSNEEPTRRRTWEIALALALKDALRSGDVYLPHSRQHVSFWELCYDESTWEREREAAYAELELPRAPHAATTALLREFVRTADQAASGLASNPYVRIEEGRLHVKRIPKEKEPEQVQVLRQLVDRGHDRVRIEDLLAEIDARCRFSDHLMPPADSTSPVTGGQGVNYTALLAAVVAHGTNLGLRAMADSAEGSSSSDGSPQQFGLEALLRVSKTCLRQETLAAANAAIVEYHRSLETARFWGEGEVASSDGQRFGVQERTLLTRFYPRYFGYYDRAVTLYTHVSDLCSVFSTQVISCAEREALYVLDGLLENETGLPIRVHHVDTHGYTDQLCGLCYLLGFSFMPRIKNLKEQRLFKPIGGTERAVGVEPSLFGVQLDARIESLFRGTVNLELIEEEWDALVRVAASLKDRVVSASVIAKRLAGSGPSNRLSKALTHLGRLVKTTYLLRYASSETLRRQVLRQLNRGEERHKLARYVFFADQGEFRKGDYERIMNQASCLSLLSNAILVWNTLRIGEVLEEARRVGKTFAPDVVARISPLKHRHVIVNGSYDFSGAAARVGRG